MALAQMAGGPIFFNNRVEAENQAPGRELRTPGGQDPGSFPHTAGGFFWWKAKAFL